MLYHATLLTPLQHGAGTAGNTTLLRTEDVILPDGTQARVPMVSGNSIRHLIRSTLAWDLVHTLKIPDGSLTKAQVDLLWSGGAITATGAQVSLETARSVEEHLPMLAMLGYAAQADITAGTLRVTNLALVCEENAWRYPGRHRHATVRAARFRSEDFGTRHDVAGTPVDRLIAIAERTDTTQMIYDMQVLKAGSVMWGDIQLTAAATEAHRTALSAALTLAAPNGVTSLGARNAAGYGQARVDWETSPESVEWWHDHITSHADAIMELIGEMTK